MAKELLTAHRIRTITTAGVYRDGAGLRLIVTARGTKRWELWITINGKKRELGLGIFPDVSLKHARDEAEKLRRAARDGIDLRAQRVLHEARALTFRQAFEDYFCIKRQQLSNAKHLRQWPSTMEAFVFPFLRRYSGVWMSRRLTCFEAVMPIWFGKPETAKRVLQRVEAVFKSAILHGSRENGFAVCRRRRSSRHPPPRAATSCCPPLAGGSRFYCYAPTAKPKRLAHARGWHLSF